VQELVAGLEVQRRRTKGQHRDPFSAILGDITQDLANGIGIAQIVFALQQFVVSVPLRLALHQTHDHFVQQTRFDRQLLQLLVRIANRHAPIQSAIAPSRQQNQPIPLCPKRPPSGLSSVMQRPRPPIVS
jgi:hypothetical protein